MVFRVGLTLCDADSPKIILLENEMDCVCSSMKELLNVTWEHQIL